MAMRHESDIMGNRITDDRKGSLTLRADHMNYSRAILNSHWHQARQAEPKDYDINKDDIRTMTYSTYKRIGNVTDGSIPETTYQEQANQCMLKPMYEDRDSHKTMVQPESLGSALAGLDRNNADELKGQYGSVLPCHNKDHSKFHLETTYDSDYIPPYPLKEDIEVTKENPNEFEDKSAAYKKMKSQFTDTANHRRNGWNTWQDESGIYANSHYKTQVFPKTTTTLPPNAIPN